MTSKRDEKSKEKEKDDTIGKEKDCKDHDDSQVSQSAEPQPKNKVKDGLTRFAIL